MSRQNKRRKELTKMIEQLKACKSLSYFMLPVLEELETAYVNEAKINSSWENVPIDKIADLIEELDAITVDHSICSVYSEILKKSTYLIDLDLWINVMELYLNQGRNV